MSKLHVNQIKGYVTSKLKAVVNMDDYASHSDAGLVCRRRFKSEPPCRSNIEPGVTADFEMVGCG